MAHDQRTPSVPQRLRAPSLRARGEGGDEGASPPGAELRFCLQRRRIKPHHSESRRGPLTLVRCAHSTSPRTAGRGEKAFPFSRRDWRASDVKQRYVSASLRGAVATKQSSSHARSKRPWIASLSLAMTNEIKEAERRQTHCRQSRTKRVRSRHGRCGLRRPSALGRARLPAFHHGSCQGVCCPLVRSGPGFVGQAVQGAGVTPPTACPLPATHLARRS